MHEISTLNHFVSNNLNQKPNKLIEIGGGKGNLS